MNKKLLSAALFAAFTACIHVFVGGGDIADPLLASALADEPRLTLYAVWHMVSVVLALSAVAFWVGALPSHQAESRYLVQFVSVLWVLFGAVFLIISATQSGDSLFLKLPQWVLLLPVGLLGLWGGSPVSLKGK